MKGVYLKKKNWAFCESENKMGVNLRNPKHRQV